jgi:hypothetical protein
VPSLMSYETNTVKRVRWSRPSAFSSRSSSITFYFLSQMSRGVAEDTVQLREKGNVKTFGLPGHQSMGLERRP